MEQTVGKHGGLVPGPIIGEGRTAAIHALDEYEVVKLFRPFVPDSWIEHELKVGQLVVAAGLPAPRLRPEIVSLNGQRGLIYERLDGPTMLQRLTARPWTLHWLAKQFAGLHVAMHGRAQPALPAQRDALAHAIDRASALPPAVKQRVQARLMSLPQGSSVCHGDFHPDNILLSTRGPIVIDWTTATHGNPVADIARTTLLLLGGSLPPGMGLSQRMMIQLVRRLFHRLYLRAYRQQRPATQPEIEEWLPIMAAARLSEQIEGEEAQLLARVLRAFGEEPLRTEGRIP